MARNCLDSSVPRIVYPDDVGGVLMANPCHNDLIITAEIPEDQAVAANRLEELNHVKAKLLQLPAPPWFNGIAVEGNTLTADFETR